MDVRALRRLEIIGRRTAASRSFGRRMPVVRSSAPRPFGLTERSGNESWRSALFRTPWLGLRSLRLRTVAFRFMRLRLLRLRWFGLRSLGGCRLLLCGCSDRPEIFHRAQAFGLRAGGLRMHGLRPLWSRFLRVRALAPRSLGLRALARPGPSQSGFRSPGRSVSDHWLVPSFVVRSFQAAWKARGPVVRFVPTPE